MKEKTKWQQFKKFALRKRVIIPFVLVLIIVFFTISSKANSTSVAVVSPSYGKVSSTISSTGQVVSNTDLSLSFNKQGIVKSVKVNVGDKVKKGQVLANIDQAKEWASVMQARGALSGAKARLARTIEGATNAEINLARVSLENAKRDYENTKKTQETLVSNAYNSLLNSYPQAIPQGGVSDYTAPVISGNYKLKQEGTITISTFSTGSGKVFSVSGLTSGTGYVTSTTPQSIGDSGLYITFPQSESQASTNWTITIPNTKASNYLTNYNAYQNALSNQTQALSSSQALIDSREAELEIKLAKARTSDIDLASSEVVSAEGSLANAQALYEDTIIRAPSDGTITRVDIKYGELAEANKPSIVLQDIENLYIESLINESNIAVLRVGLPVSITLDALGKEIKFTGSISQIDPSSDTTDGVVNYKIKISINEKDPNIRPGMNSEVLVLVKEKEDVLALPKASLVYKDGKYFVNIITNEKRKKYIEKEITIGEVYDGNNTEILSDLSRNDKVAIVTQK